MTYPIGLTHLSRHAEEQKRRHIRNYEPQPRIPSLKKIDTLPVKFFNSWR